MGGDAVTLAGKTVIVTGAGTGIGRATACMLAERQARCVLLGRRKEVLDAAREACIERSGDADSAIALAVDVGDQEQVAAAVASTLERFGRLDAVVNNAGVARFAPIAEASPLDLDLMLDVHLRGPIYLIQAALSHLRESRGSVVNVTSVGGALATPGRSFYGATKAALNHLTRSLARELAPEVRVNAVLPGPVDTPIYDDLGLTAAQTAQLRKDLLAATPMGRFGTSEEVAHWIIALVDDTGGWVTGTLVAIDGGRTC
jgi:NAD(P)-dependent dehydrogenase (short-subunit alcohol dehydrogenase family)